MTQLVGISSVAVFLHEQAASISSQPTAKSLPTLRFQKNGNGKKKSCILDLEQLQYIS